MDLHSFLYSPAWFKSILSGDRKVWNSFRGRSSKIVHGARGEVRGGMCEIGEGG